MIRPLTIAAVVALLIAPAPARAVTAEQFDRVHAGWSRAHTQRAFDDDGTRTAMWATARRRHLVKVYPASGGDDVVYVVHFIGPLCSCGPYAGPYHVRRKETVSTVAVALGAGA